MSDMPYEIYMRRFSISADSYLLSPDGTPENGTRYIRADTPTSDERKAALADVEKAKTILSDLCSNSGRYFRMSIPVQDDDSDMVLSRVIKAAEEAALQQPDHIRDVTKMVSGNDDQTDTPYDPALYNADMDQLEFVTEDVTVVAQPINGWFNVLRKNGTDEIIGLQLNGPIAYAKHIAGQCEGKPDTSEAVGVLVEVAKFYADDDRYSTPICGELETLKDAITGEEFGRHKMDDGAIARDALKHPAVIAAQKGDDRA